MRMDPTVCRKRLMSASFGVLGTSDPDRGTHLVPVVFAVRSNELVIPIDAVKPKSTTRLRRIDNLRADPRASLLVDHREADWRALWWVRVDLQFRSTAEPVARWRLDLANRYPQYDAEDAIESLLVFTMRSLHGWAAG